MSDVDGRRDTTLTGLADEEAQEDWRREARNGESAPRVGRIASMVARPYLREERRRKREELEVIGGPIYYLRGQLRRGCMGP